MRGKPNFAICFTLRKSNAADATLGTAHFNSAVYTAERAASEMGAAGLHGTDRRAELLQPPGQQYRAGRQARPGRQAPGPDNRHRREDRPSQPGPRHPGVGLHVRPSPRIGTLQGAYPKHAVDIPAGAVDGRFVENLGGLIRRLASQMPARRVSSPGECRFCEITPADCPERADEGPTEEGTTGDF